MAGPGKGMGLLIGIGPKPGAGEKSPMDDMGDEPMDSMEPDMEGRRMAAAALRSAIQSEDDDALFDALKSCFEYLDMEDDDEAAPETTEEMPEAFGEA